MLRESEKQYYLLVGSIYEGIWMINDKAKTTFADLRMAKMYRYRVEEMIGRKFADYLAEKNPTVHDERTKIRYQGFDGKYGQRFRGKENIRELKIKFGGKGG